MPTSSFFTGNRTTVPLPLRVGAIAALGLFLLLRSRHNFTEIAPTHDALRTACYVIAGAVGIAGCLLCLARPGNKLTAFAVLIGGGFFAYLVCSEATSLIAGAIDFPSAHTSSYTALLPIADAYSSHSRRGRSFHIHTTPRADLIISHSDYDLMAAQQSSSSDYDNLPIDGAFCVLVTLQRSGDALRILHPGFGGLPTGSIHPCSQSAPPTP